MKVAGKVGNEPLNNWLNFGGDSNHRLDTGIVFRFVTIGRHGKWYQPTVCATLESRACSSRYHHRNYHVLTSPALGGDMHYPSASSY